MFKVQSREKSFQAGAALRVGRPSRKQRHSAVKSALTASAIFAGLSGSIWSTPSAEALDLFWIDRNEYEECAADLLGLNLEAADIADACASGLHPDELSACVVDIDQETAIEPQTALSGCKRVRRPDDLATCVIRVDANTSGVASLEALDHCRRSLLPLLFSDCVVGLRSEMAGLEPLPAMNVCISADDRPIEYRPDFVFPEPFEANPTIITPLDESDVNPSVQFTPLTP